MSDDDIRHAVEALKYAFQQQVVAQATYTEALAALNAATAAKQAADTAVAAAKEVLSAAVKADA